MPDVQNTTFLNILNSIKLCALDSTYPNLVIAYRLYLTIHVIVASGESSFSKLQLIKTYLQSFMSQEETRQYYQ